MRQNEYKLGMTPTAPPGPEGLIQAMAEPTRLRLLALLLQGETCVCDLTAALEIPQPTASRHLARLRRVGWVVARREGLWAHYSLAPAQGVVHARLVELLRCCRVELPELAVNENRCRAARGARCC